MIIKEIQVLSEGLWESVKNDLKFFSPIQLFVKKLSELDYTESTSIDDALLYWNKIEECFDKYRKKPGGDVFYSPPHLISSNNDSVKRVGELIKKLKSLSKEDLENEIDDFKPKKVTKSRTGETIINILEEFLDKTSFAILIMTAEDETSDGKSRARQNVIHEAGLFQGRLGFDKVIILKQAGVEEFSNIAGLQYIPFSDDNIEQSFYELQRKFKKLGLIK